MTQTWRTQSLSCTRQRLIVALWPFANAFPGAEYRVDEYCYSDPASFQRGVRREMTARPTGENAGDPGRSITVRMRLYVREIELEVETKEFETVEKLKEILSKATAEWEAPEGSTVPEQFLLVQKICVSLQMGLK